jgi:hypothetical protein
MQTSLNISGSDANMIGIHAKFDSSAFARSDAAAREATTELLNGYGYTVQPHPNKYAQDLIAEKGDKRFLVECEQKSLWSGNLFPFDSVQLPERKRKFFKERTLFCMWNKGFTSALMFWSDKIEHLEPVEVSNRRIKKGEYFFQIPMNLVKQVYVYDRT